MYKNELTRIVSNLFGGNVGAAETLTEKPIYDYKGILTKEEATKQNQIYYYKALAKAGHINNFD